MWKIQIFIFLKLLIQPPLSTCYVSDIAVGVQKMKLVPVPKKLVVFGDKNGRYTTNCNSRQKSTVKHGD